MELKESAVLMALGPTRREDTDQWPEFGLKQARVLSQTTGEPVNLLLAHASLPVRVEGVLEEVDAAHKHLVKLSKYQNKKFVVDNVVTYSFSQFEDGTFGFWAGGQAGWFEIKNPTREYRPIFKEMTEATSMFYFLADKFKNCRKNFTNASSKACEDYLRPWFNDYLGFDYCSRDDIEDVREGFHQHRVFLMKSMLEGQEALNWTASPILRYLQKKFPDDFITTRNVVLKVQPAHAEQLPEIAPDSESIAKPRRGRREASPSPPGKIQKLGGGTRLVNEDVENHTSDDSRIAKPRRRKRKSILQPKGGKFSQKAVYRKQTLRSTARNSSIPTNSACKPWSSDEGADSPPAPGLSIIPRVMSSPSRPQQRAEGKAIEAPLPSYYEPRGYGEIWICPYDGCHHKVPNAREVASVDAIKDHFVANHAQNAQELINEESRPWVSISHLSERVSGIASLQRTDQQLGFRPRVVKKT